MSKKAIYLSGGGARGAYQAGVLKAINEIVKPEKLPVEILSSVSAGAVNASILAAHAENFTTAVVHLEDLWQSLTCKRIFKSGNISLVNSVMRNAFSMLFHAKVSGGGYLLDTKPLRELLETDIRFDFDKINHNIEQGIISDFEISANCYDSGENTSFFKSLNPEQYWQKRRDAARLVNIGCKHILASAAIPLFFPAIEIDRLYYGDGSVRLSSPLSAAINLGAESLLVIGTRRVAHPDPVAPQFEDEGISLAKILGNMLNTLFLDNLDNDIRKLSEINQSLAAMSKDQLARSNWKLIKTLYISPSVDLGAIAQSLPKNMPLFLRYFMRAFGSKEQSGDLLSFILFESEYCSKLIDIGYHDAFAQRHAIEDFFNKA